MTTASASTPTSDEGTQVIELGDDCNGLTLMVVRTDEGPVIDVDPVGGADVRDEDGALRLSRNLAAQLASQLSEILTGH